MRSRVYRASQAEPLGDVVGTTPHGSLRGGGRALLRLSRSPCLADGRRVVELAACPVLFRLFLTSRRRRGLRSAGRISPRPPYRGPGTRLRVASKVCSTRGSRRTERTLSKTRPFTEVQGFGREVLRSALQQPSQQDRTV